MSDIIQLLTKETAIIEAGTVEEYLGNRKYRVNLNGRPIVIRAAVERLFDNGARVVINRIADMRYIVGTTGKTDTVTEKEVVINA